MCLSYRDVSSKQVKVRKPHRCGWCAERIEQGALAQARAYVFDGEFNNDHLHPECFNAMNESERETICDGWMPGDFERGIAAH